MPEAQDPTSVQLPESPRPTPPRVYTPKTVVQVTKPRMRMPDPASPDGNHFAILTRVRKALWYVGESKELIEEYTQRAKEGDGKHFIEVTLEYIEEIKA